MVNGVHKILACLAMALSSVAVAGEIRLKSAASLEHDQPITLGDVAVLSGDDAKALADITLRSKASNGVTDGTTRISMRFVREILSDHGVNWGLVAFSGDHCVVRLRGAIVETDAGALDADGRKPYDDPKPQPVELDERPTIRNIITQTLARHFDVDLVDLKLLFRETDAEFLERVEWTRRVEVRPTASSRSGAMPVRIRIYEDERIIDEQAVRVEAEVRMTALTLVSNVRRNETLSERHVQVVEKWLAPGSRVVPSLDDAVGQKLKTKLQAGELLRPEDLEPPVLIKRGELVNVKCLSGSVVLSARARALADGVEGELVELRMDDSDKSFLARVDARGRAVVDVEHMRAGAPADEDDEETRS